MRVILGNMLRNVKANKRRTAALLLCMAVVGFCAVFSFSIHGTVEDTVYGIFTQAFGDAQILIDNPYALTTELDLPGGAETFYTSEYAISAYTRSAENFIYPTHKIFPIMGMDISAAQKKGFIKNKEITLGENEIIITEKMSREMNYKIGDIINAKDYFDAPFPLTIAKIVPNEGFFKNRGACAAASIELVNKLGGTESWTCCFVSVGKNGDIESAFEYIEEHNPDYGAQDLYEGLDESVWQIFVMFLGIFIVIALIIFFVSAGMSEHIVRERMAELGTLRSLGAARSSAAAMLISENLFYGLVGAALGILLYIPMRKPLIGLFLMVSEGYEINFDIRPSSVIIALGVTALISCFSAVRAILRAVKTPIRDIIFGNQNTSYTLSKKKTIIGAGLLGIGSLCGSFSKNTLIILAGVVAFAAGLAMSVPAAVTLICRLFSKQKDPISVLALKNIHTKKMLISSATLYSIVAGLVSAVMMLSVSIAESTRFDENAGDIIILGLERKTDEYGFISELDGVAETELIFKRYEFIEINGTPITGDAPVIGFDKPFSIYRGVDGLPEKIGKDEISLDKKLMSKLRISKGDIVELKLNAKGKRPVTLTLTAVSGCDSTAESYNARNGVVISLENYKRVYYDYPATGLVKLDDPQKANEIAEKIKTLMMDKYAYVYTADEYAAVMSEGGIIGILYMIVIIGCALMLILMTTNQSIGFEQRRREFAVLHSTSMSRAQLKKMLFRETAISLLISTVAAFISGTLLYVMIIRFVNIISETEQDITMYFTQAVVFLIVLYPIALLTARGSSRGIDKMNTASQMKYE